MSLSGRDGYDDVRIAISADQARPPISTITLHFDTGSRDLSAVAPAGAKADDFVFKVDRMAIR